MTLGKLKIDCYRVIDPSDVEINESEIESVYETDTAYSFFFLNMITSINACITRIVQSCILPLQVLEIKADDIYSSTLELINGTLVQRSLRKNINLKEYADNIFKIKKVEFVDNYGNYEKLNHRIIGNFLDTENKKSGTYRIYYYPRINNLEFYQTDGVSINELDLNEIGLDDNILSIIPYYVKADLLEHDKPTEAVLARNTFEQYLASFESEDIEPHNAHKSWWGGVL